MTRLAQYGRVLYVENTGVRVPGARDASRLGQRLRNWTRGPGGFRTEGQNLTVYAPLLLPFPYSRAACRLNGGALVRAIRHWLGEEPSVLWTFLPTPLVRDVVRGLKPTLTVYYCIDYLAASSKGAEKIRSSEEALLTEADVVFATSHGLRDRALRFRSEVHLFPFGVNFEHFRAATTGDADAVPLELSSIPRPIAGYVGGLHRWLDDDLLAAVARRLPNMSFVLVGPRQAPLSQLRGASNIHLLGSRSHQDLPRYIRAFDVALIPYRIGAYTDCVYPTKLNEYLASGVPVVATPIPEIRRIASETNGLIGVGGDPAAFAEALQSALEDNSAERRSQRVAYARGNGWDERLPRMLHVMDEALAKKSQR